MATAIVDGHYLLHRMMHVPQLRMLSTQEGKPTGGVFGVLKYLRATIQTLPEIRRVVVVFDSSHSTRRKTIYPEYKLRDAKEEKDPDGLSYGQKFSMNLSYCKFVLPRMGVKVVTIKGKEGDDTVGLLARKLDDELKIVVSDDRDMLQLVASDVHVWRPMAEERVTKENFEEKAESDLEFWLLKKAIIGDKSDNIGGIIGVGKVTADKAIEEYIMGDAFGQSASDIKFPFDGFFDSCAKSKSKSIKKIAENKAVVLRNYQLVDISLEEFSPDEAQTAVDLATDVTPVDVVLIKKMFVTLEFFSMINDFSSWITRFQSLR